MGRFLPRFAIVDHAASGIDADENPEWFEGRGLMIEWGSFLVEIVFYRKDRPA
ncbi:hypothetical protein [Sphingobium sp. S6]|uniref:hypothetical protein n=1 Tax=Sphingobium sp. S6 TaxID=2758386 RepID=UPI00191B0CB8|nr:hypothetical protein [Sphingobium sp. S6]CAD7335278.1 hypothetical protein SPHS6_00418 [Sphingobium sp. S6]